MAVRYGKSRLSNEDLEPISDPQRGEMTETPRPDGLEVTEDILGKARSIYEKEVPKRQRLADARRVAQSLIAAQMMGMPAGMGAEGIPQENEDTMDPGMMMGQASGGVVPRARFGWGGVPLFLGGAGLATAGGLSQPWSDDWGVEGRVIKQKKPSWAKYLGYGMMGTGALMGGLGAYKMLRPLFGSRSQAQAPGGGGGGGGSDGPGGGGGGGHPHLNEELWDSSGSGMGHVYDIDTPHPNFRPEVYGQEWDTLDPAFRTNFYRNADRDAEVQAAASMHQHSNRPPLIFPPYMNEQQWNDLRPHQRSYVARIWNLHMGPAERRRYGNGEDRQIVVPDEGYEISDKAYYPDLLPRGFDVPILGEGNTWAGTGSTGGLGGGGQTNTRQQATQQMYETIGGIGEATELLKDPNLSPLHREMIEKQLESKSQNVDFLDRQIQRMNQGPSTGQYAQGGVVPRYRFGAMGLVPFIPGAAAVASATLMKPWQKNKSTFERALAGTMGAAGLAGMGYGAYRMFGDREEGKPYHIPDMDYKYNTAMPVFLKNDGGSDDGKPWYEKVLEFMPRRLNAWHNPEPYDPELKDTGIQTVSSKAQGGVVPRYYSGGEIRKRKKQNLQDNPLVQEAEKTALNAGENLAIKEGMKLAGMGAAEGTTAAAAGSGAGSGLGSAALGLVAANPITAAIVAGLGATGGLAYGAHKAKEKDKERARILGNVDISNSDLTEEQIQEARDQMGGGFWRTTGRALNPFMWGHVMDSHKMRNAFEEDVHSQRHMGNADEEEERKRRALLAMGGMGDSFGGMRVGGCIRRYSKGGRARFEPGISRNRVRKPKNIC